MFEVCETKCDQCLFTENRVVSGTRMKEILGDCVRRNVYFECHKASAVGSAVCCRGFYDSPLALEINMIRVSRRMNWVRFVKVPDVAQELVRKTRAKKSAA